MPSVALTGSVRPVLADLLPSSAVRNTVLVMTGVLLTAASAQATIALPFTPVPITGQTFAVLLTGAALGPGRGALTQLLYVLLGLVGLPFYAGGLGGVEVVLGATGGYLVSYPLAGAVVGACARRGWDRRMLGTAAAFVLGSLVIYGVGVPWLAVAAGMSLPEAVGRGLLPFVVGDLLKAGVAGGLLPIAWRLIDR